MVIYVSVDSVLPFKKNTKKNNNNFLNVTKYFTFKQPQKARVCKSRLTKYYISSTDAYSADLSYLSASIFFKYNIVHWSFRLRFAYFNMHLISHTPAFPHANSVDKQAR